MTYDTEAERAYLRQWAADNKVVFEEEGEVGFGRECVGMRDGSNYLDLYEGASGPYGDDESWRETAALTEPPAEVTSAYHKHDCLAVLGRGPEAIHELFLWVKNLEANGIGVATLTRTPYPESKGIDLLLHGLTVPTLVRKA